MGSRIDFQEFLESTFGIPVYFQAPQSNEMSFPCIKYTLSRLDTRYANNVPYSHDIGYDVTLIDPNPDTTHRDTLASLPKSKFQRYFPMDGLNHYVFQIFF